MHLAKHFVSLGASIQTSEKGENNHICAVLLIGLLGGSKEVDQMNFHLFTLHIGYY